MILSLDELRPHVEYPTGGDADVALQLLLDASEQMIVKRAGAAGDVTELVEGGWSNLILSRPIASLTSVTEAIDGTPLVMATNDYRYTVNGYVLRRLWTGTNPNIIWAGPVRVVYTPANDDASRGLAQVALVRTYIAHHPGLSSQTIGDWSESFSSGEYPYLAAVEEILCSLVEGPGMVVVG